MDRDDLLQELASRYTSTIPRSERILLTSTLDTEAIDILTDSMRANFLSLPDKVGYDPEFIKKCRKTITIIKRKGYRIIDIQKADIDRLGMESVVKVSSKDPTDLPLDKFEEFSQLTFFDSESVPIPPRYNPSLAKFWDNYHRAHLFLFESLSELVRYTQTNRHIFSRFSVRTAENPMVSQERKPDSLKEEYLNAINLIGPLLKEMGCERVGGHAIQIGKKTVELLLIHRKKKQFRKKRFDFVINKLDKKIDDVMYL